MGRLISRKVIMRKCYVLWALVLSAVTAAKVPNPEKLKSDVLQRFKRQDLDEDALEKQLCSDKGAGEWFRLETGADKCRDVIRCTASGLQAIRCPAGLAFDIEKQTCDWKSSVDNCEAKTKEKKVKPLLFTDEPLCQEGFLACGDGNCIEKGKFCDEEKDCNDGSDENACDIETDPNAAPICDTNICKLPDCFCSEDGTQVPGNLCEVGPAGSNCQNVPQMITITFDDAVNNNNIDLYREIFNRQRKNPNGCDIKSSYFVSHKYSNYSSVQELHYHGHEIAAHSITHNDEESFWTDASVNDWAKEMARWSRWIWRWIIWWWPTRWIWRWPGRIWWRRSTRLLLKHLSIFPLLLLFSKTIFGNVMYVLYLYLYSNPYSDVELLLHQPKSATLHTFSLKKVFHQSVSKDILTTNII